MKQANLFPRRGRMRFWLIGAVLLSACDPAARAPGAEPPEPGVLEATRNGPPGAAPGSCWGRTVSPATIETVTEQVQVRPAQVNPDGTVAKPPVYRTETRQQIVATRRDNWFETPCTEVLTPEFVGSLQRALQARGFYRGEITGKMDAVTRDAVEQFQREKGPESGVLSLETARELGLIAVPRVAG